MKHSVLTNQHGLTIASTGAREADFITLLQCSARARLRGALGIEKQMGVTTLYFLCGKMAAGKSTLARKLARAHQAVLLEEDYFLAALFPGEIRSIADYVKYSSRVKDALSEHIVSLLRKGISVVLDFPGNTPNQRRWFRQLIDCAQVAHELHYLDVSDEICKAQLRERSKSLPEEAPFTSDEEFEAITRYFQAPTAEEDFNVVLNSGIDSGEADA